MGDVGAAIRDGESAVAYADRSGDAFQRMAKRAGLRRRPESDGPAAEAEARFVEAEAMQARQQPKSPLLYSLQGFAIAICCWPKRNAPLGGGLVVDMRRWQLGSLSTPAGALAGRSRSARRERSSGCRRTLRATSHIAVDHLTLARAALYETILRGEPPAGVQVKEAVDFLRRAGVQDYLPRGLLTRALWRAASGDFDGAREDLDEAFEIAERGPMRLHLADIHLHRARLFGLIANRPANTPGSRRATISTRRASSSMTAATAGGARSSKTPRRRGSASMRPPRRTPRPERRRGFPARGRSN